MSADNPEPIRIVGRLKASPLIRFGRIQRRAARLAALASHRSANNRRRSGVELFRDWSEIPS
jgi:hypothetical protein